MSKADFMDAVQRRRAGHAAFGTGTSIVCAELMDRVGVHFPEAHLEPEPMAQLAAAGHTELGFDVVMPLFSVCHEAAAMGCDVNWGDDDAMPEAGKPIFATGADIRIPPDLLLDHPGCRVPLDAISLLAARLGADAAVCGKVMGPWTQGYHYFGVENFLIATIDDPDEVDRICDALMEVTVAFANAQVAAGADCILLADHATRDLCGPDAYERFLLERHRTLAARIDAPVLLHICGNTADRIGMIAQTGLAGFHWDTKTGSAANVRRLAGDDLALMGGVSNFTLLGGTPAEVAAEAAEAVAAGIDIVGPECAVSLRTPLENLRTLAKVSRNHGA